MDRREFVITSAMAAAGAALPKLPFAADDALEPIYNEITKRHDEAVNRLQTWIRQPSIAAEHRGIDEGCQLLMEMLKEAGFQNVEKVPTDGNPGVHAVMDNGAAKTLGLYFMYDVKQADPSEWMSPPFEARLVDKPGFGKVVVGRGAINQKGPEATFLAALHAIRGANIKVPVNFVFVAEGEEEIASPHFAQVVHRPDILAQMTKCEGVYMPMASQDADGDVTIDLGAKGVIELELVSSGEKWGRGPMQDLHSSNKARVDSPAWHLVKALNTLVSEDGNTPFEGFAEGARPLSSEDKQLITDAARRLNEITVKKAMGVQHWIHDVSFQQSLEMLAANPTINIEGLVGGYTGPGGKTILPHRAVAKIDCRLVPDMTAKGALQKLKDHLAHAGFGDIEVNLGGGYDPTSTPRNSALIQKQITVYKRWGLDPVIFPRLAGSWPGTVFTGEPLNLPAGHFGMGHGNGAHAPNEFYVIESSNPKVQGMDGAAKSQVQYLYELAKG